jgi:hypothetical protein
MTSVALEQVAPPSARCRVAHIRVPTWRAWRIVLRAWRRWRLLGAIWLARLAHEGPGSRADALGATVNIAGVTTEDGGNGGSGGNVRRVGLMGLARSSRSCAAMSASSSTTSGA